MKNKQLVQDKLEALQNTVNGLYSAAYATDRYEIRNQIQEQIEDIKTLVNQENEE
jgi:hypothetical protein